MAASAYRLKSSITVVVRNMDRHRLIELPPGSVFYATILKPDSKGMIDGICGGNAVLMFSSDLEDRTEPTAAGHTHERCRSMGVQLNLVPDRRRVRH
jgi:hypothetical protein